MIKDLTGTRKNMARLPLAAWGLSPSATSASASAGTTRSRVDLAGAWQREVHGKILDVIEVPSSRPPLGFYRLRRDFALPALTSSQRAFVHFDAINYHGRVFVNGAELGTTIPYVPFDFEFTKQAREGKNTVEVAIADLQPEPTGAGRDEIALGVNPGWEAYGGIIRDAYVEVRPAACVDNLRLGYQLSEGYTKASCQVRAFLSSSVAADDGNLEVVLSKGGSGIARAGKSVQIPAGATETVVSFEVEAPDLWSPEEPNLYELRARLKTAQGEDQWSCRTGLRDVAIRGNRFELNGQRLVLNGVCRHDMWKDQGFTLTRAQMAQDMRMIKALGANFVRLVHYPHHRYIIDLADELGLLVTEEPGYWNMDFRTMPRTTVELGYRIMEATIRRDWNSPSVFAWLLGNECTLTVEYLKEGKERCRKLDPISRPVSFANSMGPKEAKPIFEQAGMDFFDAHVYPSDPAEYANTAEHYGDSRPLTFTEWGWETAGDKDIFPETQRDLILNLVNSGKLAGHSFWSWQDVRQYSRIDWPTANGILMSGVVTESREVRPDWFMELSALFQGRPAEPHLGGPRPTLIPLKWAPTQPGCSFSIVDLQPLVESAEGAKAWAALEARLAVFWPGAAMAEDQWKRTGQRFVLWQGSDWLVSGVPVRMPAVDGHVRPLVLTPERPVKVRIDSECERLHILGQVTFPAGYPAHGSRGETVATYHVNYSGGKERRIPVRNGIEVAQANLIHEATRIDPIATEAQPVLKYVKDIVREQYQVLLWTVPLERGRVETLRCELQDGAPLLAIFAITTER